MNEELENQKNDRIFLAFPIPQDIGMKIRQKIPGTNINLYPEENLHLTLKFIGETSKEEINYISRLIQEITSQTPAINVNLQEIIFSEKRARVTIEKNYFLMHLYRKIASQLRQIDLGKTEINPYEPHITIGRIEKEDLTQKDTSFKEISFEIKELKLYKSEQGEEQIGKYSLIESFPLKGQRAAIPQFNRIILPTRTQPDTLVTIFILKKFGQGYFHGIKEASIDFLQVLPEGQNEETLEKQGYVLLDIGSGRFDHHGRKIKTTSSELMAEYLGVKDYPPLAKLLAYAQRDDFYGKGTVSEDPLDRAFGLSAIIANLNKSLSKNPARVVEIVMPILIAHYNEELKRTNDLPKEVEEKIQKGEVNAFEAKQRGKKLKIIIINSDNPSLPGYLRSQQGGKFDVVAQWLSSGHVNILTRPAKRIDLRSLAVLIRLQEANQNGKDLPLELKDLAKSGRIKEIPEWYYDPATNSIQNGGINPKEVLPTKIPKQSFKEIIEAGLSEKLWDPRPDQNIQN